MREHCRALIDGGSAREKFKFVSYESAQPTLICEFYRQTRKSADGRAKISVPIAHAEGEKNSAQRWSHTVL